MVRLFAILKRLHIWSAKYFAFSMIWCSLRFRKWWQTKIINLQITFTDQLSMHPKSLQLKIITEAYFKTVNFQILNTKWIASICFTWKSFQCSHLVIENLVPSNKKRELLGPSFSAQFYTQRSSFVIGIFLVQLNRFVYLSFYIFCTFRSIDFTYFQFLALCKRLDSENITQKTQLSND